MGGRRAWEFGYSPHLPPVEAWKEPERWINTSTGRPLPDSERIILPVDDRGIIKTDEAVSFVKELLFHEDYDWSRGAGRVTGDIHHFYHPGARYSPAQHDGDETAMVFRETPTLMGRMPRQFHDALHDFTLPLRMPDREVMYEYRQSYLLAHQAFLSLIQHAKGTTDASRQFQVRRRSLELGHVIPKEPTDQIAQEILRDSFSKHFSRYTETVDMVREFQKEGMLYVDVPEHAYSRPHLVATKLSRRAIKECVNFLPLFQRSAYG